MNSTRQTRFRSMNICSLFPTQQTPISRPFISYFLLINFIFDVSIVISESPATIEKYIEQGTRLLAAGQVAEALVQYSLAIESDEKNYLSYFRRATAYMALGKSKSAISDFDKCIEINPSFIPARKKRVELLHKVGDIQSAMDDYEFLSKNDPSSEQNHLGSIDQLKNSKMLLEQAKQNFENDYFAEAVAILDKLIDEMPQSKDLREMRGQSYLKLGEKHKAINDFRQSVKQTNDNTDGILQLSILMYNAGEAELSLQEVRECLKLDQDHKQCFVHYKLVKKLAALLNEVQNNLNEEKHAECLASVEKVLKLVPSVPEYENQMKHFSCRCSVKSDPPKAIEVCAELASFDPENLDWYCELAEAHINNEQLEEAIKDYQEVLGKDRNHARAKKGMNRAQKLLKSSRRRDYYKILGVSRTASKADILKAYRKMAREYHPDHTTHEKKFAESKFIDISSAKEVLTDPEKRQKFDNGEDPLDPEHQGGGGHNPFGQTFTFTNFNPFGGGGNFEFHFG